MGMSNLKIEVCHLWHAYVTDSSIHQITWILNLMRNKNLMLHTRGSSVKNHQEIMSNFIPNETKVCDYRELSQLSKRIKD